MKEYRTLKQIEADRLDLKIFRAAGEAEALGLMEVRRALLAALYDVRKLMHVDDLIGTSGSE